MGQDVNSRHILNRVGKRIGMYLFDVTPSINQTIWVVGDGRSGTTWLSNLINFKQNYRYIFEPFHPKNHSIAGSFPLFHYVPTDERDLDLRRAYLHIFGGKPQAERIDLYNTKYVYRKRLVKDIFAHLYLGWAVREFPGVKKILIVRHPFSVSLSKLRHHQWTWLNEPAELLKQRHLVRDIGLPLDKIVKHAKSDFEKQVVIWCVIHRMAFNHISPDGVHVIYYEELCRDPVEAMSSVFQYAVPRPVDLKFDNDFLGAVSRPSEKATPGSQFGHGQQLVNPWRDGLTNKQKLAGLMILREFGLYHVYDGQGRPSQSQRSVPGVVGVG